MVLCAHVRCFAARAQDTDCCYESRSIPDKFGPIRWQETRLTNFVNKMGINRHNKILTDNLTNYTNQIIIKTYRKGCMFSKYVIDSKLIGVKKFALHQRKKGEMKGRNLRENQTQKSHPHVLISS